MLREKSLPRNVRVARNVVFGFGVFIAVVGVLMLIAEPKKWQDWLGMFSGAVFAFGIVRAVNRGEGEWQNTVSKSTKPDDSTPR